MHCGATISHCIPSPSAASRNPPLCKLTCHTRVAPQQAGASPQSVRNLSANTCSNPPLCKLTCHTRVASRRFSTISRPTPAPAPAPIKQYTGLPVPVTHLVCACAERAIWIGHADTYENTLEVSGLISRFFLEKEMFSLFPQFVPGSQYPRTFPN